ncbi:MAG: RidA family protein [Rhodobacteraceae bacterium]|nr:RidA family protein [Paracoccaceae bacterium]
MTIKTIAGGGRFEKAGSYARVKRVGPFVFVAGLTAMQSTGKVYAPYDIYEQTRFIFDKIEDLLDEAGAKMRHIVRTRAFLSDIREAGGFIRCHGEVFQGIEPVLTGVEAGLTTPGMLVEIEVDAIIHTKKGGISLK